MEQIQFSKLSRTCGAMAIVVVVMAVCAQLFAAQGAGTEPKKSFLNPAGLSTPRGYTHVVSVEGGRTVFIAGQVSLNAKGEVIGKGDLRAQATQVYENLKTALAAVGATPTDVVKLNTYVVNLNPEALAAVREVRGRAFPQKDPPASTLVGVSALANPDFLIEIEAIAVIR